MKCGTGWRRSARPWVRPIAGSSIAWSVTRRYARATPVILNVRYVAAQRPEKTAWSLPALRGARAVRARARRSIIDPGAAIREAQGAVHAALRIRDHAQAAQAIERLSALCEAAALRAADRARLHAQLGDYWSLLMQYERAQACYGAALALCPEESHYWFNRAAVRRFLGTLEEAEADYDRAIALAPDDAQAYLNRSELRRQSPARNHVPDLERALARALARTPRDWRQEVPLRYALAKEYEDLGEYERSWQQLSAGARVRRRHLQYNPSVDLQTVDWLCESFPASLPRAPGAQSREPIFILGMPRTGSTLVDRMLGGHSAVFSAGELPDFALAVVAAVQRNAGRILARQQLVAESARLDFRALGEDYLQRTRPRTGHTPHFTDKLPLNYLYCGLIARALPEARIVHVTRGAMATCYGIYKVLFEQGYPFSYDLLELADHYIGYRRLMEHWKNTLPEALIEIRYEALVANPVRELQKLLDALSLPWEPQCLEFERNPNPVATASAAQVRRPIYRDAVDLWRHYERELEPLAARLRAAGIDPEN